MSPGPSAWYCLVTARQKEPAAVAWLGKRGVTAWFPTEERWRRIRGPRRKVPYQARLVPGYAFAWFPSVPRWHILFDSPYLRGVLCDAAGPIKLREAEIMAMKQVPEVLAERKRREAEAKTIRPGDSVEVLAGPLAGNVFRVESVRGEALDFLCNAFSGSIGADAVRKIAS